MHVLKETTLQHGFCDAAYKTVSKFKMLPSWWLLIILNISPKFRLTLLPRLRSHFALAGRNPLICRYHFEMCFHVQFEMCCQVQFEMCRHVQSRTCGAWCSLPLCGCGKDRRSGYQKRCKLSINNTSLWWPQNSGFGQCYPIKIKAF